MLHLFTCVLLVTNTVNSNYWRPEKLCYAKIRPCRCSHIEVRLSIGGFFSSHTFEMRDDSGWVGSRVTVCVITKWIVRLPSKITPGTIWIWPCVDLSILIVRHWWPSCAKWLNYCVKKLVKINWPCDDARGRLIQPVSRIILNISRLQGSSYFHPKRFCKPARPLDINTS